MPQYYTLQEAAQKLGMSEAELKDLSKSGKPRAFLDRGTMRFRGPEIDELARQRGQASDHDLQLGEAPRSRPIDSPTPKKGGDEEVFDFELPPEDSGLVEIGQELNLEGGSKASKSSSRKSGKSPSPKKKGSDSDVRLVPDDKDLGFKVSGDSDVKLVDEPGPSSSTRLGKSKGKRPDSGVKMVDTGSDSDVKIVEDTGDSGVSLGGSKKKKSASDSDIRLEDAGSARKSKMRTDPSKAPDDSMLTEEIDLDAELKSAEQQQPRKKTKGGKGGQQPSLPTSSPFELSEADLDMDGGKDHATVVGDSDLELTPVSDSSSPLEDDEIDLGMHEAAGQSDSGINLQDPADSGISLERGGSSDEIEFELSLESGATPKPAKKKKEDDSSSDFDLAPTDDPSGSEFELSLEDSSGEQQPVANADDSDSEFELSLDSDAELQPASDSDSDSEFELTLDDSGVQSDVAEGSSDEEKDIFETDFEVPALDEESGSEAVALDDSDTDLESSDFDLALDESDSSPEDESGSQVVALDDEEGVDEGAETVARPRAKAKAKAKRGGAVLEDDDSGDVDDLFDIDPADADADIQADDEEETAAAAAPAKPANWGVVPTLFLLPGVVVLLIVTLMGYELVRSMAGYKQPNTLTRALVDAIAPNEMPKGE